MKNAWMLLGLSGLLGFGALSLAAADVTGDWSINGDVAGNPVVAVCTLKQDSDKLTGTCKGDAAGTPLTGDVNDKKVTFTYELDYQGQHYTLVYAATLESDTSMKGTIDVGVANGDFTAKKQ